MSFLSKNITVRPLEEELELLGLNTTPNQLATLASKRLDESFWDDHVHVALDENVSGAAFGFGSNDASDEFVTHALLGRIRRVAESASDGEIDEIYSALMEMQIDENDETLISALTDLLDEGAFDRVRSFTGKMKKRAKAGFKKVNGKFKRMSSKEKAEGKRKRKTGGYKAKKERSTRKREKTGAFKMKQRRRERFESSFEDELRDLLGESEPTSEYQETVDRIERIMALIEQELPEAGGVMAEAFESLGDDALICESVSDFSQAVVPCITLIKRCLEEIEAQDVGN